MRVLLPALLIALAVTSANAGDRPMFEGVDGSSFQSMWSALSRRADCAKADHRQIATFTCDEGVTLWYFTKPGNPAHPGVIERYFVNDADGGTSMQEDARSFGDDAAQPAFKAWLDSFVALDEQMKDHVARKAQQNQQH